MFFALYSKYVCNSEKKRLLDNFVLQLFVLLFLEMNKNNLVEKYIYLQMKFSAVWLCTIINYLIIRTKLLHLFCWHWINRSVFCMVLDKLILFYYIIHPLYQTPFQKCCCCKCCSSPIIVSCLERPKHQQPTVISGFYHHAKPV